MPAAYNRYKDQVAVEIKEAAGEAKWFWHDDDRYSMSVTFVVKRPKNHWRTNGELKPSFANKVPAPRQDIDNFVKAIMDAATSSGHVWKDDNRVCELHARTVYEDEVLSPGIVLDIVKVVDGEEYPDHNRPS